MKKLAALGFATLALSFSAFASSSYTATCTAFPANLGATNGATTTVSCPGFSAAGAIDIASAQLQLFENWNGGNGTATVGTIVLTAPTLAGISWGSATISSTSNSNGFTGTGPTVSDTTTGGPFATGGVLASSYSVGLASSYTGSLSNNSGYVTVTYTYDTATGTPEPVSMVLFGSGLLAVSLIGRKKFASK